MVDWRRSNQPRVFLYWFFTTDSTKDVFRLSATVRFYNYLCRVWEILVFIIGDDYSTLSISKFIHPYTLYLCSPPISKNVLYPSSLSISATPTSIHIWHSIHISTPVFSTWYVRSHAQQPAYAPLVWSSKKYYGPLVYDTYCVQQMNEENERKNKNIRFNSW